MVLKFRLISNEQDDFIRDFEVLADQTFFDLHMAIQDNLRYDKSQIASFFLCSREWEKEQEITLFELSVEEANATVTMDNAVLGDYMHRVHDKMIYVFDVFNERIFFIELAGKGRADPALGYPRCSFQKGKAPQQLLMERLFDPSDLSDSSILEDPDPGEDFRDTEDTERPGPDLTNFEDEFPDEY